MKKLVSLLLALALLLGMASALAETEGKNVYIVTPYLTSVTTKDMAEYIKGNLEEVGCKVTVIDTEGDTATFASRIEDAVTAKADAIVIISVDHNIILVIHTDDICFYRFSANILKQIQNRLHLFI